MPHFTTVKYERIVLIKNIINFKKPIDFWCQSAIIVSVKGITNEIETPRKKELFLVIDTETTNTIEQPLCYDIGYAICDRKGNIYEERSNVVAEMFIDHKVLMISAYYAEKLPQYWEDLKNGKREMKSIFNIRKQI